jgi:hypothetical protein
MEMNIKGTAFLARKKVIVEKFGQEAWDEFLRQQIGHAPFFAAPVMASTNIPIESFLTFQDAMVKRFFNGNTKAYWDMGAASAQWSLTEGPYRTALERRDLKALVETLPGLWNNYYDEGRLSASLEGNIVHVHLYDVPVWHVSLELIVMGYFHRALELFTKRKVAWKQVSGGAPGVDVHYKMYV